MAFTPPIQREVMVVTDYEILAIVLMIITVVFTIHIAKTISSKVKAAIQR